MALLMCVECGRPVSDQAAACPGCGLPATARVEATPPTGAAHGVGQAFGRFPKETRYAAAAAGVAFVLIGALLVVRSAAVSSGEAAKDRQRTADALVAADRSAAEQAAAAEKASEKRRAESASEARTSSAAMTRAQRDKWLWHCVETKGCAQWQVDAILAGAPEGEERDHAERVSFAASSHHVARENGKDGNVMLPVPAGLISGMVARDNNGFAMLELIPHTTLAEAKKDPGTVRGSVVKASGSIVEIHVEGGVTHGALMTGDGSVVRFVTSMSTNKVYAGSWAQFEGVFVQQYGYANVSGGQTLSTLLVGAFDVPENRKLKSHR